MTTGSTGMSQEVHGARKTVAGSLPKIYHWGCKSGGEKGFVLPTNSRGEYNCPFCGENLRESPSGKENRY
jgi:hypothetical protein